MDIQEYIKAELIALIPVIYIVGITLKRSRLPDKWIPVALGFTSVALCAIWVISSSEISGTKEWATAVFTVITQGVLIAGASVYANQLLIQSNKKE